ncbi:D-amino acid dehydrogenase [Phyllobacterium sp. 21LDTY02-6]|jgi:D-amino-acid dehydrogenase|uniref:D-amino acid dehydrogenase n=1 Tax=unclassified Phyllobacterium TaxID=2638441 RepID=UPI00202131C0|nr:MULTISPECIES: D-amino acid dehydrogenase [unclassified Phyllobacterium]MCO4318638.1 D-amino acid dehydrogenase [Phyllobacterium sp. 21LDTY02-6]MCX8281153.1 D-amino acid dehydrogenase [Phyllobacterium sp. 0TCS1.6C]MCX8294560.1 D-amino acid dehydrogenase [Phyllobacterium sp. 0TCS1.6A]
MKVLVLGSGVVGVTSAWYLTQAGHEVTVVDRQPGPARETSFANAGEISPGYSSPWAGPGIPLKAIKWMLMHFGPLVVRPKLDPYMALWLVKMLRNCTNARYARNKARMVPIAEYSRDTLKALRAETGIAYDERALGTLQLFRDQKQYEGTAGDINVLKQFGVPYELLDADGCITAEPALANVKGKFVGGLRLPGDETGDCQIFTEKLAARCAEAGVKFLFNTTINSINTSGSRIASVSTDNEELTADAYVMAFGSYSPFLLRRIGVYIPVYPVKGYSITVPISDPEGAPVSTVMDETYKVAITRLGDRIRAGGTAEISGFDLTLREARRGTLVHSVGDLFPNGGDLSKASFWTGLRPMTPDGPPIIGGGTRYSNLYLNTGHGTLGWTMSCGSARVLSDLVSGKSPDVDPSALSIARYM